MRERLLRFCTCTSLEIMTAVGVAAYLLYLGQSALSVVSGLVFAKVIALHLAIEIHERLKQGSHRAHLLRQISAKLYMIRMQQI